MIQVNGFYVCEGLCAWRLFPLGMKRQYVVVSHCSAEGLPTVMVSAGKNGYQVEVSPRDLVRFAQGRCADIVRHFLFVRHK